MTPSDHKHVHHTGRRLRHFFKPDGTKVHIAGSPDEANCMRAKLSTGEKTDADFDLVTHGSPEHIEALRPTHSHHEVQHNPLKQEHSHIADEVERVVRELDILSLELTAQYNVSKHAVQLDANFSKLRLLSTLAN